jgi:hypothetical protein
MSGTSPKLAFSTHRPSRWLRIMCSLASVQGKGTITRFSSLQSEPSVRRRRGRRGRPSEHGDVQVPWEVAGGHHEDLLAELVARLEAVHLHQQLSFHPSAGSLRRESREGGQETHLEASCSEPASPPLEERMESISSRKMVDGA